VPIWLHRSTPTRAICHPYHPLHTFLGQKYHKKLVSTVITTVPQLQPHACLYQTHSNSALSLFVLFIQSHPFAVLLCWIIVTNKQTMRGKLFFGVGLTTLWSKLRLCL